MIDQREILWGVLAPPVLMAIAMVATVALPTSKRFLSTGALLALVFGVCHLGFRGLHNPWQNVQEWPAWIAFAAGLMAMCSACGQGPVLYRVLVRFALTAIATWLLLRPQLASASVFEVFSWIVGLGAAWTIVVVLWERIHAATTPGVSLTNLVALAGLSAGALLMFNCVTYGQFAGIFMAAFAAAAVLGWWKPAWYAPSGPVLVGAVVLPMLWLMGYRYAELPVWSLPILALAGLAPLIIQATRLQTWSGIKRVLAVVVVTVMVASPVLAWGVVTSIKAAGQPKYGY